MLLAAADLDPLAGGLGGGLVPPNDQDIGSLDQEGVGDARAHASAAENADGAGRLLWGKLLPGKSCREAGGEFGAAHVYSFFPASLADFLSRKACIRSNLAWDSKRILRQLIDEGMRLGRGVEHGLGDPDREGSAWRSVGRVGRGHQPGRFMDFGDEVDREGAFGAQHGAGEQHFLGDGFPDELP